MPRLVRRDIIRLPAQRARLVNSVFALLASILNSLHTKLPPVPHLRIRYVVTPWGMYAIFEQQQAEATPIVLRQPLPIPQKANDEGVDEVGSGV